MLKQVQSVDHELPDLLLQGFPIVGPIACSNRWPPYPKDQSVVALSDLEARAWATSYQTKLPQLYPEDSPSYGGQG